MVLHKLERINYGRKWLVSIKYQNLHSFKEGLILLSKSILKMRRITHLHGSAHFTIPLKRRPFTDFKCNNELDKIHDVKFDTMGYQNGTACQDFINSITCLKRNCARNCTRSISLQFLSMEQLKGRWKNKKACMLFVYPDMVKQTLTLKPSSRNGRFWSNCCGHDGCN